MSIGSSIDLKKMLKTSLSTYLRKLNCSAGGILYLDKNDKDQRYRSIITIPRNPRSNIAYQYALEHSTYKMDSREQERFRSKLPISGVIGESSFFHILELPGYGVIILIRNGQSLDPYALNSLEPLNAKLANACNACVQNDILQKKEEKYRAIFEQFPDLYFQLDEKGIILELSPSVKQISGYNPEDLIGSKKTFGDFF